MKERFQHLDPAEQLALLRSQAQELAPVLYREHALYLQSLREILLKEVQQAVFGVITESGQNLLAQLKPKDRLEFKNKVELLSSRCKSLLTVEQLMDLFRQMEQEYRLNKDNSNKELLMALSSDSQQNTIKNSSIELSLDPPLENPQYLEALGGSNCGEFQQDLYIQFDDLELFQAPQKENMVEGVESNCESSEDEPLNRSVSEKNSLDLLSNIFMMARESMQSSQPAYLENEDSPNEIRSSLDKGDLSDEDKSFLPDNPIDLADWVESLDLALARRLRNLSYALNVELLRVGIINSLLPMPLLDASLRGQIDSLNAPSNILKMTLPLKKSILEGGMSVVCVLLRTSDLEFDNQYLSRCRTTLRNRSPLLLKMIKQQSYWQSRLNLCQASKQWWKSSSDDSTLHNNKN